MAQQQKASLREALQRVQQAIAEDDGSSAAKHKEATDAVAMLQRAVERPDETFGRQRFSILLPFVIRFALEYGILQTLAAASDQPKTAAELAQASGADELIIVRAMRLLTANGICDELGHGKYAANAITQYTARTPIIGGFLHLYDHVTPIMAKTSELIQAHQLGTAASHQSPLQDVYGAPMFGVLAKNPSEKKNFDNFMQARLHPSIPKWFDIYDAQSELAAVEKTDGKALIVDVGGGKGHDIASFAERFDLPFGKLVLQDLAQTFESGLVAPRDKVTIMAHDFFTGQPVKGAHRYMMRQVLHDWSDEKAEAILRPIVAAMNPQQSRLLLVEYVLDGQGVDWLDSSFDIVMWLFFNGIERTHAQWSALLDRVGLKIVKIWSLAGTKERVIEAGVKTG